MTLGRSDIGMPGLTGVELRRLAPSERPELPVILITGRAAHVIAAPSLWPGRLRARSRPR
jgi:FixJ family two-component response regulator